MLNETYEITEAVGGSLLTWTSAAADLVSFVFLDSKRVSTQYAPGTTARALQIPLSVERTGKIEIHDLIPSGPDGLAIAATPNTSPLLYWDDVAAASSYRIYTNDVLVWSMPINDRQPQYTMIYPFTLDSGWQSVRIEAVDSFGEESTRASWRYYVLDLPEPQKVTEVTGTGGVFDITIGAV